MRGEFLRLKKYYVFKFIDKVCLCLVVGIHQYQNTQRNLINEGCCLPTLEYVFKDTLSHEEYLQVRDKQIKHIKISKKRKAIIYQQQTKSGILGKQGGGKGISDH